MTLTDDPGTRSPTSSITTQVRVLQIATSALVTGVLIFGGYVILTQLQQPPQGTTLSFIAVGFGALSAVLHVVVPMFIERAALANQSVGSGPEALVGVYFTRTIIAAALLEGAALMSLTAVMTEHQPWVLGVTLVLLALMVMQIPTRTRVEHWLEMRLMEREQGK